MAKTLNKKSSISKKNNDRTIIKTTIIGDLDYIILLSVVILVLLGIVMVFSASYYNHAVKIVTDPKFSTSNVFYLFRKQAIFAALGFISMLTMSVISHKHLKKLAFISYVISIILLIAVLFFGDVTKGARRWLEIFNITFQPSELAKVSLLLFLSTILSKNPYVFKNKRSYITLTLLVALPAGLTFIEPDLSTSLIIILVGMGILFVASPHIKVFILGGFSFVALLISYLLFSDSYHADRVAAYRNMSEHLTEKAYQPMQALYAIASGGFFGLGLGQSRQKLGIIPDVENDMIFSIVCEELGFLGAAIVLVLFSALIWRGIKIAINSSDLFGCYLATGITIMIAAHVVINVGVVTSILPNTGLPLPFISSGGTSLIIFMTLVGMLLNIARYSKENI